MIQAEDKYVKAELERLKLLMHRQILRVRGSYQLSLDELRGLYVSDQLVDDILKQHLEYKELEALIEALSKEAFERRTRNQADLSGNSAWMHLVKAYKLSNFEQDCLLLALAPEFDRKYTWLCAYLNNDVSQRAPTIDLALRLFSEHEADYLDNRAYLTTEASLLRESLLHYLPYPGNSSWLLNGLVPHPALSHFLLGHTKQPAHLATGLRYHIPQRSWDFMPLQIGKQNELRHAAHQLAQFQDDAVLPAIVLFGEQGKLKSHAAEAICYDLSLPILIVDCEEIQAEVTVWKSLLEDLRVLQVLYQTAVIFENVDDIFTSAPIQQVWRKNFQAMTGLIFFTSRNHHPWREVLSTQRFLSFEFSIPNYEERCRLWKWYAGQYDCLISEQTIEALASHFQLNPEQIEGTLSSAKATAMIQHGMRQPDEGSLFDSASEQSFSTISRFALKVTLRFGWNDLILPPMVFSQVQEICAAIRSQHLVFSQWQFSKRSGGGAGIRVLFSGASGTGKTMSVSVIAKELNLQLYRVELSQLVSKYIGETEKHLDLIFYGARANNAILFFDEADAIFGKRSEVKDAHDRYANIEVAYLLQKMEEHEGVVFLASNLGHNIDNAFARRMQFVIDFPMPDAEHREQLWRRMFEGTAPIADSVDFGFLAQQFNLSGGDIKNVALHAAFLAAQNGQVVNMQHLAIAVARQMIKQGKVPSQSDFREHYIYVNQWGRY